MSEYALVFIGQSAYIIIKFMGIRYIMGDNLIGRMTGYFFSWYCIFTNHFIRN